MAKPPARRRSGPWPFLATLIIIALALAATNPDEDQFRSVMRSQDSLMLDAASLLPIERTNFIVGSKFEIKYLVGSTTCWGFAAYVFLCPQPERGQEKR